MGNILFLFIILLLILWFCLLMSKRILIAPAFCFTISFIFSTGYALFSLDYIQLDMSFSTFLVLASGVLLFALACFEIQFLSASKSTQSTFKNNYLSSTGTIDEPQLIITPLVLVSYIFIALWVIYGYRSFYTRTTGLSSFTAAMYTYRHATMFTSQKVEYVSNYLLFARRFCVASGYIFSYVLFHSIVNKYKINKPLVIINIILAIFLNTLSGSRGPAITYIMTMVMQFYLIYGNKKQWIKVIKFKHVFIGVGIFLAVVFTFQLTGNLLGRSSTKTLADYLAVYVSAPIKNLDTFLCDGKFGSKIENNQTFVYVVNYIGKLFGVSSWTHTTDQPFQYNMYGYGLGNVYTTFYAFLYDAGVFGLVFYTVLMAVICQISFMKAIKIHKSSKAKVRISILVYSYIVPYLLMSFFSNKFYENIFNQLFWLYLFIWCISSSFLFRIKIKTRFKF